MKEVLQVPLKKGGTPTILSGSGPVEPFAIRAKLMLEVASHMMTESDWPYRQATIDLESQGDELGNFRMFGANSPNSIRQVFERKLDISIMNPGVILSWPIVAWGFIQRPWRSRLSRSCRTMINLPSR